MKSLILSTSDIGGGAARAAYRLHQGLQRANVESHMLVQEKLSSDRRVHAPKTRLAQSLAHTRVAFDALPLKKYPQRESTVFSLQWLPDTTNAKISSIGPDIINLHWVNQGFVRAESIARFRQPVVWTLHDMWAFTGGCHYNQDCDQYLQSCGACPQLNSHKSQDLSRWVWQRKANTWQQANLTIVTLSSWLKHCAQSSALLQNLRIELIPNGIDTEVYKPVNKQFARQLLGLPQDKSIVLFGAVNPTSNQRKGFHLLQPALQELGQSGWSDRLELAIFGASRPENAPDFGLVSHYLGSFHDDLSLSLVYSAADVFVLPSVQDNLPNTVMEAIACGVPCVAFNIGGLPDMIDHQQTGYLGQPYDIADLARGIAWVLDHSHYEALNHQVRTKAEQEFSLDIQASRYRALYTDLLESNQPVASLTAPGQSVDSTHEI